MVRNDVLNNDQIMYKRGFLKIRVPVHIPIKWFLTKIANMCKLIGMEEI